METFPEQCEAEDSLVCYCHRLTTKDLKEAYKKYGCLKGVEQATKAGTGCTGCKVILHSLFGEAPSDASQHLFENEHGSACIRPGHKVMKGLIISDGVLESRVFASNGVAPQLGQCDARTRAEAVVLDHNGQVVLKRDVVLSTNETFVFDTREEDLPRPFYGMFMLGLERANFGASRFYISWSNEKSATSTHENASSGRPRIFVPISVDGRFIESGNKLYLAILNPHQCAIPCNVHVIDMTTKEELTWSSSLGPLNTAWIDASERLYRPALEEYPGRRFILRIDSACIDFHQSVVSYFFIHNQKNDLWTCNHI